NPFRVAGGNLFETGQSETAELLVGMRLGDAEQLVQAPDPLGQLWLGQDPAAADAAEPIDLGKTVGGDELRAEMRSRARARRCIEIDLVDQHARPERADPA